jgi:hypothetical protein
LTPIGGVQRSHSTSTSVTIVEPKLYFETVAAEYQRLATAARRGDIGAAKTLYQVLDACSGAPRTAEVLQRMVAEIDSQGGFQRPEQLDDARRDLAEQLERCKYFSGEQIRSLREWLVVAAEAGDASARRAYIERGAPPVTDDGSYPAAARAHRQLIDRYVAEELAAGNIEVLRSASWTFSMGNGVRADPELAYAYTYAYGLAANRDSDSFRRLLSTLAARVPAGRLEEARRFGAQLYTDCCRRDAPTG